MQSSHPLVIQKLPVRFVQGLVIRRRGTGVGCVGNCHRNPGPMETVIRDLATGIVTQESRTIRKTKVHTRCKDDSIHG